MVGLHGILYWDLGEQANAPKSELPRPRSNFAIAPQEISLQGQGHLQVFDDTRHVYAAHSGQYTIVVLGLKHKLCDSEATSFAQDVRHRPSQALRNLDGEFAVCITDNANREILLATDTFGTLPFYYAVRNNSFLFSTDLSALIALPSIENPISPQSIFDFLYFTAVPAPNTIYTNIHRVPPGHILRVSQSQVKSFRWYSPEPTADIDVKELEAQLVDGLRESVQHRWTDNRSACFLSGGLDSSTVCALASGISSSPVNAYSIGFDDDDYDEIGFARIAAERFKLSHHVRYVSSSEILDRIDTVASAFGEPFANASAITALICAETAFKDGVRFLLAGDGGDELFAGNERYRKQMLLQRFYTLPAALRSLLIRIAKNTTGYNPTLVRKALSYIRQAALPFSQRLQHYNFIEQYGVEKIFSENFLTNIDRAKPTDLIQNLYAEAPFDDFLKRMLFVDWNITLADNDLRKVRVACQIAGVDVAFPMLGSTVLAVAEKIPGQHLMPRGRLRGFYKNAFAHLLPSEIINKPKHGFGVPVGRWMTKEPDLASLVQSRLSSLEEREILLPDFLASVRSAHKSQDAVHFGVILWTAFMLETWFQSTGL